MGITLPLRVLFAGHLKTAEAITDTPSARYFWIKSKHGVSVPIHERYITVL